MLYIVRFLHQTTTDILALFKFRTLYIVRFLHQTTTFSARAGFARTLYIVRFLHQTTTGLEHSSLIFCCISSVSYIKPQLPSIHGWHGCSCISSVSYIKPQRAERRDAKRVVVYRPFPTSNHNIQLIAYLFHVLYIVRFLHQTTTLANPGADYQELYIVRFLHQTTT